MTSTVSSPLTKLQVSVHLGCSVMDDLHGVFVAYKGLGLAHAFEKVGSKTISKQSHFHRIRGIERKESTAIAVNNELEVSVRRGCSVMDD